MSQIRKRNLPTEIFFELRSWEKNGNGTPNSWETTLILLYINPTVFLILIEELRKTWIIYLLRVEKPWFFLLKTFHRNGNLPSP